MAAQLALEGRRPPPSHKTITEANDARSDSADVQALEIEAEEIVEGQKAASL